LFLRFVLSVENALIGMEGKKWLLLLSLFVICTSILILIVVRVQDETLVLIMRSNSVCIIQKAEKALLIPCYILVYGKSS
jgi:hypothetical protein